MILVTRDAKNIKPGSRPAPHRAKSGGPGINPASIFQVRKEARQSTNSHVTTSPNGIYKQCILSSGPAKGTSGLNFCPMILSLASFQPMPHDAGSDCDRDVNRVPCGIESPSGIVAKNADVIFDLP